MMTAIRIHEFGNADKIKVEEIPLPDVESGQALVRIKAAGVNPVDWMVREQIYNPRARTGCRSPWARTSPA